MIDTLDYRVRWRSSDVHPGSHRSRVSGAGDEFRGAVPLAEGLDARRIDLRATLADPWERAWVREFRQRARVPVWLLADVSRSMRFAGRGDRTAHCVRFARALSHGSFRRGDPFGFLACDRTVRHDLHWPASVSRHGGEQVARRLTALQSASSDAAAADDPRSHGAEGLAQAARWLPRRRSLVFLLSDLYLDGALFERVLRSLAQHDVVVVMLTDSAERAPPGRWGLVRLADLETGRDRLVFLRPGLAERMAHDQAARVDAAARTARRLGATLVVAEDRLDLDGLARHLLQRAGA